MKKHKATFTEKGNIYSHFRPLCGYIKSWAAVPLANDWKSINCKKCLKYKPSRGNDE